MEKLYAVNDDPPLRPHRSRHAADDATRSTSSRRRSELARFLDERALRLLRAPERARGAFGMRMLGAGSNVALGTIERLTGGTFLADLSEFLASFRACTRASSAAPRRCRGCWPRRRRRSCS